MPQRIGRNFYCFLAVFYMSTVFQSMVHNFLGSAVQSLERQFQIPSSKSGLLVSASRFGTIPTVLLLAYFGSKGNKVRWIGAASLLIAAGCLLAAAPNFLFPLKNQHINHNSTKLRRLLNNNNNKTIFGNENSSNLIKLLQPLPFSFCNSSAIIVKNYFNELKCKLDSRSGASSNEWAFILVFAAFALFGIGQSVPWTIGTPLIDDSVKRKNAPYFFAVMRTTRVIGPLAGLWLAAGCFKLYVNLDPPNGLTPLDPRWIGAWWLGFLVIGSLLIIPSVILLFFKKQSFSKDYGTPSEKNLRDNLDSEDMEKLDGVMENNVTKKSVFISEVKEFIKSLVLCLKSPVYVFMLLARMFETFAYRGIGVFLPKFIENHYGVPQHEVTFFLGVVSTFSFAGGTVAGSFIMKKFKLEGRRAAFYSLVTSILTLAITWAKLLLKCKSINSVVGENGDRVRFNLSNSCNYNCQCNLIEVYPVCSPNGQTYFSPCHAGCTTFNLTSLSGIDPVFTDCACAINATVSRSFCSSDCTLPLFLYYGLSVLSGVINGTSQIPHMLLGLRAVPHKVRSVSLAFNIFVTTLFSSAPSPIIAGKFIDGTCLLWNKICGKSGACLLYNSSILRIRFHMLYVIMRLVSILFEINVWYWASTLILTKKDKKKTVVICKL